LHDAPWQTFPFGSPQYATSGSEGCVRLPEKEMAWVYGWAPIGTTVTVVG
jgi:lipoprotein-anchoring transpeptidase ErfK/SrfK